MTTPSTPSLPPLAAIISDPNPCFLKSKPLIVSSCFPVPVIPGVLFPRYSSSIQRPSFPCCNRKSVYLNARKASRKGALSAALIKESKPAVAPIVTKQTLRGERFPTFADIFKVKNRNRKIERMRTAGALRNSPKNPRGLAEPLANLLSKYLASPLPSPPTNVAYSTSLLGAPPDEDPNAEFSTNPGRSLQNSFARLGNQTTRAASHIFII